MISSCDYNCAIESMSGNHRWPLSQAANEAQGTCCTCFQVHQLHLKDNTVHSHGPRTSRCSGSNKPPLASRIPGPGPVVFSGPSLRSAACSQPLPSRSSLTPTTSSGNKSMCSRSRLKQATSDVSSSAGCHAFTSVANDQSANLSSSDRVVNHPKLLGPILKHIPRSARPIYCS